MKFFLFLFFCFCSLSAKETFHELVFLGDDYTDIGNVTQAPYTETDQNWASALGQKFGFEVIASKVGGIDYAASFSETGTVALVAPNVIPLTPGQVDQIRDLPHKRNPVLIWSGTNDIAFQSSVPFSAEDTSSNLAGALNTLHDYGYQVFILANQFDLGKSPKAGMAPFPSGAVLSAQVEELNQLVVSKTAQLPFPVFLVDLNGLFNDILAHPSQYGFTNVTDPAPFTGNVSSFLFLAPIFSIQPFSMQFHNIFADYVFAAMQGAQIVGHLAEQALGPFRSQSAMILQQLYPARPPVGKITPFFTGGYGPSAEPIMTGVGGTSSQSGSLGAGLIYPLRQDFSIGAAWFLDLSKLSTTKQNVTGRVEQMANTLSVFLNYAKVRYYVTAVAQYAWLKVYDYKRSFYTGPVLHEASASTNGTAFDLQTQLGYFLYNDPRFFQTGPLVKLDFAKAFIDGFQEEKSSVGNLQFGKTSLPNLVTGLGWEFRLNQKWNRIDWILDLTALANCQWLQKDRPILLKEVSIGAAPWGSFIIAGDQTLFGTLCLHLSGIFPNGLIPSLGYLLNYGENHLNQSEVFASIAF